MSKTRWSSFAASRQCPALRRQKPDVSRAARGVNSSPGILSVQVVGEGFAWGKVSRPKKHAFSWLVGLTCGETGRGEGWRSWPTLLNCKKLEAARKAEAALAAKLNAGHAAKYKVLPASIGLSSVDALIKALLPYASPRTKGLLGRGKKAVAASSSEKRAKKPGRRKRAKITDETRAELKKLVHAGKTGTEIAKALGISLPSVQNFLKDLGLVKGRK